MTTLTDHEHGFPVSKNRNEQTSKPAARTVSVERSLSPMRRTIADRLGESYRNAIHVTVSREAEVEGLVAAVDEARESTDVDVSLLDIVLQAVSMTLTEHPEFNATFEDDHHIMYEEHNLGVAVDIEGGLVAPVIADVANRSLEAITTERRRLTERVTSGEFAMSDLQGGTFTVTNLGVLGIDSFTPVINPPQVAILGVNRLRERAMSNGSEVEFRRHMNFDLSFDHRVVDGADAARFLDTFVGFVNHGEP